MAERVSLRPRTAFAQIAQSVEQGTENPRVGGSIPSLGTEQRANPEGNLGVF